MSGIKLHREHGINPKLTYCRRCGGETSELMLIGANDGKYECSICKMISFGSQQRGRCPKCERDHVMTRIGTIEEGEKLPSPEYCDACKKELKEHKQAVADGGIYWTCSKCGSGGVIKVSAPLAAEVRKAHGIEPPGECGIDFEGTRMCPVCNPALMKEEPEDG